MRTIILLVVIATLSFPALAQMRLNLGYYSYNIAHPGLKLGAEFGLKNWEKSSKGAKKQKLFFIKPQLGGYSHQKNHSGVVFTTDFGVETSKNGRFYYANAMGIGGVMHVAPAQTYSLTPEGTLEAHSRTKKGYLAAAYHFELGQHFSSKLSWYCKVSLVSKFNYNLGMAYNTFQELGIKFKIK